MGGGDLPASSTYSGALSYHYPQAGLIRRSLPNMAHSMLVHEPAKIYPYHILLITNYRLPSDVDRCNLEVSRPWDSSPTCSHFNFMFFFCSVTCPTLSSSTSCSAPAPSSTGCPSGGATSWSDAWSSSKKPHTTYSKYSWILQPERLLATKPNWNNYLKVLN